MGEAKRRKAAGNAEPQRVRINIGEEPDDHPHLPGTISVHVLYEGGSLSGSLPLEDVDRALASAKRMADEFKRCFAGDIRQSARSWIAETFRKNEHLQQPNADGIIVTALWLAYTAPEPQRSEIRERLREECRVALMITEHSVHGQRAINGRTAVFSPEMSVTEMIATFGGVGPSTDWMVRQLAPN